MKPHVETFQVLVAAEGAGAQLGCTSGRRADAQLRWPEAYTRGTKTACARSETAGRAKSVPAGPVLPNVDTTHTRNGTGLLVNWGHGCQEMLQTHPEMTDHQISYRGSPDESKAIFSVNTGERMHFKGIKEHNGLVLAMFWHLSSEAN